MTVNYGDVDIRLAVGEPVGDSAIKIQCPDYIHTERLGQEDAANSLAVYRGNVHCFGCGFHLYRRYDSLAFLLGEWNGLGGEDSPEAKAAVERVRARLEKYVNETHAGAVPTAWTPPPVSKYDVEAFHQYMLRYKRDRMEEELLGRRGFSYETIREWKLGYTGTHFTIPVPDLETGYLTIRYRADEAVVRPHDPDYRKYEGTWGRNTPFLYPLRVLRGLQYVGGSEQEGIKRYIGELWVVEGEYDALSVIQAGDIGMTVTNGASTLPKIVNMLQQIGVEVGRWVLATDQDTAGEQAAKSIFAQIDGGVRARWDGAKDLTEYYASGGLRQDIYFD